MLRIVALMLISGMVSGCLASGGRHPIQDMLVGRTVVYDLPESTKDWTRPAGMVPETQSWAADGSTVHHRRPWLVPSKVYPKTGRWWIKGNRYCSWFGEGDPPKDLRCYNVRNSENGRRIHFKRDGSVFDIFRDEWHGRYLE